MNRIVKVNFPPHTKPPIPRTKPPPPNPTIPYFYFVKMCLYIMGLLACLCGLAQNDRPVTFAVDYAFGKENGIPDGNALTYSQEIEGLPSGMVLNPVILLIKLTI